MSSTVTELTGQLARFAERCRSMRWFGALFHVGVAQDIAADIATHEAKVNATFNEAKKYDLEALAELEAAQHPDSDGGRAITPKEIRRIKPLIVKSATVDDNGAGMTRGDAA